MQDAASISIERLEGLIRAFERDAPRAMCRPALMDVLRYGFKIVREGDDEQRAQAIALVEAAAKHVMDRTRGSMLAGGNSQEARLWAEICRKFVEAGAPRPSGFEQVMRWAMSHRPGNGLGSANRIGGSRMPARPIH